MPKSRRAKAVAISASVKKAVMERDGGLCVYCHNPGLPEAHFISRRKNGMGIEENILTLCRKCHKDFDFGTREDREGMREYFKDYLMSKYPHWDEKMLVYRRYS